jgi:replicative DNA helicase
MSLLTTTSSNSDVERGFLSCVTKSNECLDEAIVMGINAEWFQDLFHQKVWTLILEHRDSDCIDVDVLLAFRDPEDRTQVQFVMEACETSAGFGSFVDALKESYIKNNLRKISLKIQDDLKDNQQSRILIEEIDRELTKLTIENKEDVRSSPEIIDSMWEQLKKRMEQNGMSGIPSGINRLDQKTYGWQPNNLIVIAARTSVGKTAFGCEMALNALKNGKRVLFFSLEMKAEAVMRRLISNLSEVPVGYIIDNTARPEDIAKYQTAMDWMKDRSFWVDDRGNINSAQVRAKARKFARKGLDMIVVDYAQKMRPLDGRIPREQQVAEIAGSMKDIAMELDIPVILLSQLNRSADELNRKPRLSDMRESGALEQDADACLMLWRKNDDPDQTIISLEKQRDGACGDIEVCFKPKIQKFTPRPTLN